MSTSQVDVMAAAPHGSAAFVLGNDAPSPGRKGAARGRASLGGSKIPHRPSGADAAPTAFVTPVLASDAKNSSWTSAPQPPQQSVAAQGLPTAVAPAAEAASGGTAAQAAGAAAQVPNLTPREASGAGPSADASGGAQAPIFAVGAADRQPVGLGTPRGGRMRANKYKSHGVSSLLPTSAPAPAAGGAVPAPFSPIAMTPMDDNTYQKASSHSAVLGGPSPMDITPQSSGSSSLASSNVFLISPLLGVTAPGQAAGKGGAGSQAGMGPSAAVGPVSPAPFQGFTAAASEVPPSPVFPVRFPTAGGAADGSGTAAAIPSEAPAASAKVPHMNSGGIAASNAVPAAAGGGGAAPAPPAAGGSAGALKFPIQIQIPGAREVQDLFSSAAFHSSAAATGAASGAAGVGAGNPAARSAGAGGTTATASAAAGPAQQGLGSGGIGSSTAPQSVSVPSWPSAAGQAGAFSTVAAAAVAVSKKMSDTGPGGAGGLSCGSGGGPPSQTGGNDCQPAKDNAPKAVRISSDSNGVGVGTSCAAAVAAGVHPASAAQPAPAAAFTAFTASGSTRTTAGVAAAVGSLAASLPTGQGTAEPTAAATAVAALGLAAASAAAVASVPSDAPCTSPDVLEAVAEQLERMARRTREAAAAAAAARASGAAEAAEAVAAALASETSPAVRSVLEMILRPDVLNAKTVGGAAPDSTPGLAAAVACMIGGLRLDDTTRGASGGGAVAAAAPTPVLYAFGMDGGSSRSGSAGSATASSGGVAPGPFSSAAAAATACVGPVPPPPLLQQQRHPQQRSVPFVFGGAPTATPRSATATAGAGAPQAAAAASGPAPGTTGPSPFAAPFGAATAATAAGATSAPTRPLSGGSATSLSFTFGAASTQPGQPGPSISAAASVASAGVRPANSGVSVSGAAAPSFASAGASPMSTTPVSSNHQPPQQPTATSSSGWTNVPQAGSGMPVGGEPLKFTVGSSGGATEAAAAGTGGVTPGRSGGRARTKVTPRKSRSAAQSEAGVAQRAGAGDTGSVGPTSSSSTVPTAPPTAAAAGQQSAGAAHAGPVPPQAAQPQQGQSAQQGASVDQQGLDTAAVQAVRLKRSADEKKQYGNQKYEQSDFKSAERWYSEAIELLEAQLPALSLSRDKLQQLFPTLKTEIAVLYSNRSGARLMTSKPHSALEDALRAMSLDPKFMRAASRAATCHCRLGDFAAAHRIIDSAMDRCSASSSHYQDMLKKLNEVVDLGARARAATAAAVAAAANGSREKLQEAADQLAAIRDQVSYCEVVAAARAVLALRLGSPRDALTLVAPHPEVPLPQRAAPWRMWLMVQAKFFRGDLQEAIVTCRELQLALETTSGYPSNANSGSGAPTPTPAPGSATTEQDASSPTAAAAAYTTSAHVTVPPPAALSELAEHMQRQLKLREDGNAAYKAARYAEAADLYSSALAMGCCPAFAAVLHGNRAASLQAQGQLADAVADCGRARALDPSYYRASSRLAALMLELRRPENGQGLLEPLTKLSAQSGGSGPGPEELAKIKEQLSEARSAVSWQKTPHHYKLLGLASGCSEEDVRKAYRRLALKHHPDKAMAAVRVSMSLPGQAGGAPYSGPLVGGSELETRVREEASWLFNFINQAHEELSDKARRRKVDQLLDVEQPPAARYGSSASNPYSSNIYGGSRYGNFSNVYGFDPFFQRPAASAGAGAGAAGGRTRTATGGGAAGGAGAYGGYGGYGSYGGARPNSSRPAATAGAAGTHNSTRGGQGAAPGGARPGASSGTGAAYGNYARPTGGGGAGRASAGGRKWWEGGTDGSDDEDQDTFNF